MRSEDYKFLRNLHDGTEEWYDLKEDPGENTNIIEAIRKTLDPELRTLRKLLNDKILKSPTNKEWSDEEKTKIKERLRQLGYTS